MISSLFLFISFVIIITFTTLTFHVKNLDQEEAQPFCSGKK